MSNYPDDMNWSAYDALYCDWKPTRDEARRELAKLAAKYAPLIEADYKKLMEGNAVHKPALEYDSGKATLADILEEMLLEGAYEDLNSIEKEAA